MRRSARRRQNVIARALGDNAAMPLSPPRPADALRRLIGLRWLSLAAMLALLLGVPALLPISLPRAPLINIALALTAFNIVSLLRLARGGEARPIELFAQLCGDLAAWGALLYFTGGATNPLIPLLLPLVAIGAAVLPAPYAWLLAALAVAAYSLLWTFNEELDIADSGLAVHWHLAGMWLSFALSALVITGFVGRMTAAIRQRDLALAEAREERLRGERIVALGNLAAGAAHELGTPLATITLLAGELAARAQDADSRADLSDLQEQIAHCKRILGGLTLRAGSQRAEGGRSEAADRWIDAVVTRWQRLRPHVALSLCAAFPAPAPRLIVDATLEQAIHTLINNAADASPGGLECRAGLDGTALVLAVLDRGPGLPPTLQPGREAFDSAGDGLGIGLLLAFGAVERCGGRIAFAARPGGGTIATLTLPLAALTADSSAPP
jgi:two-component system sensor histidine kinase RegB